MLSPGAAQRDLGRVRGARSMVFNSRYPHYYPWHGMGHRDFTITKYVLLTMAIWENYGESPSNLASGRHIETATIATETVACCLSL